MLRHLSPYEKNQLQKFGLSTKLAENQTEPVEYLTGHVDFCSHDFLVSKDTLIPRIETQEVVDLVLPTPPTTILDIGTGSGALGISISLALLERNIPHQLYLSDISKKALKVAHQNSLRLLPADHQPIITHSDLLSNLPDIKFDLITANLPYIPSGRLESLDPSVKDHEPLLALDGGPSGAEVINSLLTNLPKFTHPGSVIILEIDHTHTTGSFTIPSDFSHEILPDSFGQTRFLKITKGDSFEGSPQAGTTK